MDANDAGRMMRESRDQNWTGSGPRGPHGPGGPDGGPGNARRGKDGGCPHPSARVSFPAFP